MQSDGTDRMYRFLSILAASNQLLHSLPRLQSFPSVPADFPAGEGTSQVQETSLFNSFLQGAQVQFCFLPQFFVFFFSFFFVLPSSMRLSCSSEAGNLLPTLVDIL